MKRIFNIIKPLTQILLCFSLLLTICPLKSQSLNGSFDNKFKRYVANASYLGQTKTNWSQEAWKGERIVNQMVLWTNGTINNLQITATDLTGTNAAVIPASAISFQYGVYAKGDQSPKDCGGFPNRTTNVRIIDAWSPVAVTGFNSSDPVKLWAVIQIPANTPMGYYTGKIIATGGNSGKVELNVNIYVNGMTLPPVNQWAFHLDLWQFPSRVLKFYNDNSTTPIALWSDAHFTLLEPFYRALADCGQKAITAQIKDQALGEPTMVKWTKKTNGTWDFDFSVFDKFVSKMMEWGISNQISCFSPIGWNEDVIPYYDEATQTNKSLYATIGSSLYNSTWSTFLTAFKAHLDTKGWFDKTVIYFDEINETKLSQVLNNVIIPNNPNWKVGGAITYDFSASIKSRLYDLSGVLGRTFDNSGFDNKIFTFYTSCSQLYPNSYVTVDNTTAEMTWMGWYAANAGYKGYLRWAYDYWQLNDPFDARDKSNTAGDFSIVYRSANTGTIKCYPSLRLMMLREGIQDYEKIRILRNQFKSDPAKMQQLTAILQQFTMKSGEDVNIETTINQAQQGLATLSHDLVSGINEVKILKNELHIYPNPASDRISFSIPDMQKISEIQFFSLPGTLLSIPRVDIKSPSGLVYSVSHLPAGIYFVRVRTDKNIYSGSFIHN